jgi:ABC-type multidrug transport system ATPase subunit
MDAKVAKVGVPGRTGTPAGVRIDVESVSHRVGRGRPDRSDRPGQRGRQTLRNISLTVAPGQLVAIVGSSGAGKTMLLDILAGVRTPAEGRVRYDGVDRHANRRAFRSSLGYVPQDDIIHRQLPLARTLRHAARLRLPAGASARPVDDTVRDVLAALDLTDRAGAEVRSLSGGERKRASIAVELLTGPRVFFLDEPTSGLDPASAADFMRVLRRLADGGTTVVLTTHNVADLAACDTLVFLTRDGNLAFTGPPGRACEHFGVATLEGVYGRLADETSDVWRRRFTHSSGTRLPAGSASAGASDGAGRAAPAGGPAVGAARQWAILTHRNVEILVRDRLTLAILLGSPVMVLLMFVVLFRPHAFSLADPSPNATVMTVFWVAFGGFFFGITYGLPQICAELPILRRERLVGLRVGPYVLSKLAVLVPLLAAVDAVTLGVLQALDRLPTADWAGDATLFVTLLLASTAALALGLLTSAAVSDPAQATVALPMLCFPQVLFSGAILPVPAMAGVGRTISYPMSNRWAFEGLGHSAGLERLWTSGGSPLGPPLLASYGDTFSRAALVDWAVLAGFTALLLTAACLVVGGRTGGGGRTGHRRRPPWPPGWRPAEHAATRA